MHVEILEQRCAEALLGYSQTMADAYTTEPECFAWQNARTPSKPKN